MASRAGWFWTVAAAALGALVGAAAGTSLFEPYQVAASVFLAAMMAAIAFVDFRELRVPDILNLIAAGGGLVVAGLDARWLAQGILPALAAALLSLLICGGVFFLLRETFFRLRGFEGLGLGDVKLAATGGIWLSWRDFPLAVLVAAIVAILLIAVAALLSRGAWSRGRKIPFATFLAPAIWLCWIYLRLAPL
jgi:leader peptidase (prepilin peptidase)/N-methyltransferase